MTTHHISFREVDYDKFAAIRSGLKPYETRAASDTYLQIAVGDRIEFSCNGETFTKSVSETAHFPSLDTLFQAIPYKVVIPEASSLAAAKDTYLNYPDYPEKLAQYGIVAIKLEDEA